ncbi:putative increased recombination centers protein 6 [[Candida] railenensis]|uniref:Increased recombination centers protein 6 n=1 Tax=[Candida] railenensis TaxID=45579 RepID=A0A9P0QSJ7_9ASCO|nr:putative increased recombination centers protein 6 [[Candida] railenensis]
MFPSHVLVLGGPGTGKLRICKEFTTLDLEKVEHNDSHSGLIVPFELSTAYYNVNGKLLIDEYPASREGLHLMKQNEILSSLRSWGKEFTSDETKELRECLEGLVFCIDAAKSTVDYIESSLEELSRIRSTLDEESVDGMWPGFLAVVSPQDDNDIEDLSIAHGFEFISISSSGVNEFKDKVGKERLKELFETHEWKQMERNAKVSSVDDDNLFESRKRDKISKLGMTVPLLQSNDYEDGNESEGQGEVEGEELDKLDFSTILSKLNIAKEEIQGMNENEREEYANKVIADVMNYI